MHALKGDVITHWCLWAPGTHRPHPEPAAPPPEPTFALSGGRIYHTWVSCTGKEANLWSPWALVSECVLFFLMNVWAAVGPNSILKTLAYFNIIIITFFLKKCNFFYTNNTCSFYKIWKITKVWKTHSTYCPDINTPYICHIFSQSYFSMHR